MREDKRVDIWIKKRCLEIPKGMEIGIGIGISLGQSDWEPEREK